MNFLTKDRKELNFYFFGNMTIDSKFFTSKESVVTSTGGAVFFGAIAVKTVLQQVKVRIFTIGAPRDLKSFKDITIVDQNKNKGEITQFILDYTRGNRNLTLNHFPKETINPPINLMYENPNVIFILPVYHEIKKFAVVKIRKIYPKSLICCDPQGWLREKDGSNRIIQTKWEPEPGLLESIDVVKISSEDLSAYDKSGLRQMITTMLTHDIIVIITVGREGSFLFERENSLYCPVLASKKIKDTTGAGDMLISLFGLIFYIENDLDYALAASTVMTGCILQIKGKYDILDYKKLVKDISSYKNNIQLSSLKKGIENLFSILF